MALLAALALATAPAAMPDATACAGLTGRQGAIEVDSATVIVPAPEWRAEGEGYYQPEPVRVPLCRVAGRIEGNIGFELWLPMNWNGPCTLR